MPLILSFLVRVLLLLAGLAVAASMLVVFAIVLAAWGLRAAWARLAGRPVARFGMPAGASSAFEAMMRRARAPQASRTPRADAAAGPRRRVADVTDVQPRPPA